jgi:hypothetical protein
VICSVAWKKSSEFGIDYMYIVHSFTASSYSLALFVLQSPYLPLSIWITLFEHIEVKGGTIWAKQFGKKVLYHT